MSDEQTERWLREYILGSDHPDFRSYAGTMADELSGRFLWLMHEIICLGRIRDSRVLDIGCGFGWNAVAISILAGSSVYANDIRPWITAIVAERVAAIRGAGAPVSVQVLIGDVCSIELPESSLDAIVCNQTIEHVHNLELMLRVCWRLLKPGGRIVITNDNNALNSRHLAEIRQMWRRRDRDWEMIEELKQKFPEDNLESRPYAVMREEIVRQANPGLVDGDVARIVEATAGLTQPEIVGVASRYGPGAELPTPPPLSWCRNPITGEYCEKQLDPFAVAELMQASGFAAQVRHGFRRFPLSALNRVGIRPINHLLFQLRPFFILVGIKPG
jgi:ubiquinone/menaquinone biosynthesis C-methylase UbiE